MSLPVTVQYRFAGAIHSERAVDVSEGGIRLEGASAPVPGTELRLFVPLPTGRAGGWRMLVVTGRVLWRNDSGTGIGFVDAPTESLRDVRELAEESTELS